ncbi:MAG: M15 family metallopeptidase [Methylophilaceae bacterium]
MSARLFTDDILFFQRILKAERLYTGKLDGDWGSRTETAAQQFMQQSEQIKTSTRSFDMRTEGRIATLALVAQKQARLCLARIIDGGIVARIISGTRTYAEQGALYKQGRYGNPGKIITKANSGQSNHNFGIAWDIGIFTAAGGYLGDGVEYDKAGNLGRSDLVEWGGEWKNFVDKPHYQLRLGKPVSQLRAEFEAGTLVYPKTEL